MTAPFQIDSNASYLLSDDVEVGGGTQATVPAHPNVRNTTVHPNVMTALVHPNRITAQQHQHNNMDQANCPGPSQQIGDGGILTPIRSIGINHPNGQFGGPFHSSPRNSFKKINVFYHYITSNLYALIYVSSAYRACRSTI